MLGQFLDSRCLQANNGKYYEVTAFVKVVLLDGSRSPCTTASANCPQAGILTRSGDVTLISDLEPEVDNSGYQRINGFVRVDNSIAESKQVFLFVRDSIEKRNFLLDNVTMRLVREPNVYCKNIIMDGGMVALAARYWQVSGSGQVTINSGPQGSKFLAFSTRTSTDGLMYKSFRNIEKDCLMPGSKWKISAQIRLVSRSDTSGLGCDCDVSQTCPLIQILISDSNGDQVLSFRARNYTSTWKRGSFNQFVSSFQLPRLGSCINEDCVFGQGNSWDGSVGPVSVLIRGIPLECNLHMDNVTLSLVS